MKIACIIDLDGTLYDNSHRQHLIPADRSNTAGWVEFNCACTDDVLREDMSDLVRCILLSGREVIFLTGRGEAAGEQTMQRLLKDFNFIEKPTLIMRPMDCHTSAAEFKRDAVKRIRDSERWAGYDLIALEDDPSIVEVMRGMGVTVLHIDSKCCTVEKPHHNGMMQLSNELADLKRRHAELEEVIQQRNGECSWRQRESYDLAVIVKSLIFNLRKTGAGESAIFTAEDFLKRHGLQDAVLSFSSRPSGELSGNTEQLDTAPAQFESLAGEPVTTAYRLPSMGSNEVNEASWVLHNQLTKFGPLNGYQFNNLKGCFYEALKVAMGNSPVIPDGWVMVPRMLTPRMITKLQQKTEIGSYIAANWAGAYDLFQKFWDEAIAAAPQQEVKS